MQHSYIVKSDRNYLRCSCSMLSRPTDANARRQPIPATLALYTPITSDVLQHLLLPRYAFPQNRLVLQKAQSSSTPSRKIWSFSSCRIIKRRGLVPAGHLHGARTTCAQNYMKAAGVPAPPAPPLAPPPLGVPYPDPCAGGRGGVSLPLPRLFSLPLLLPLPPLPRRGDSVISRPYRPNLSSE